VVGWLMQYREMTSPSLVLTTMSSDGYFSSKAGATSVTTYRPTSSR
jgi:hypothetical protein